MRLVGMKIAMRRGAASVVSSHQPSEALVGREVGPYSTRNSSKGSLISESHSVFRALGRGKSLAQVRAACLSGKMLRQSDRKSVV